MGKNEQDTKISNVRNQVFSGLFWTYAERICAQGVSFIISLVLARLLSPDHYGTVAIVNIFITIFNVFVTSGLGAALVQKKSSDELDFSTACHAGFFFSLLVYGVLFVSSPLIASFFDQPELTPLLRVLGIRIPIASFNTVQHAYVSKHMIFKKFFYSTLFGTLVSAVVGIVMAYNGCGTWSLIGQYLTNTVIDSVVLFIVLPWRPHLQFSFKRLKEMASYGWKILVSDLIQAVYNDLRSLAIGKKYTAADLAYYNRGQQFTSIIVTNVDASITKVLFPAMAKVQDNREIVKNMTRKSIRLGTYILSPLLVGLFAVAKPLILLILTDKWLETVPYLQILCVANLFQPIHQTNIQAIKAIGRSDIILKIEMIKKFHSIVILLISILCFDDPFAVAVGFAISTFISIIVNCAPNKKLLNYSVLEQMKDILPNLLLSVAMGIGVGLIGLIQMNILLKLIIQVLFGMVFYISLSALFQVSSYQYLLNILRSFAARRKSQ